MGIGNTTPSAAITAVVTGADVVSVTGRGTGVDDAGLEGKIATIRRALEVNQPDGEDGLDVLSKVGGFEIGVLAGVMLGAAARNCAVVVDGFISGAAALIAWRLCPNIAHRYIAAHRSVEPGHNVGLQAMGLSPLLNMDMRLGEGTGAALGHAHYRGRCQDPRGDGNLRRGRRIRPGRRLARRGSSLIKDFNLQG